MKPKIVRNFYRKRFVHIYFRLPEIFFTNLTFRHMSAEKQNVTIWLSRETRIPKNWRSSMAPLCFFLLFVIGRILILNFHSFPFLAGIFA